MAWSNGVDITYSPIEDVVYVDDIPYYQERTCKNKLKEEYEYGFECSECLWDNLTTEDMPASEINFCPNCGAKVVE